ncbi:MAG: DUF357 domain-containing protein [Caldisphaera sp.]|nr:DUF357 domain-containing protein [Caldisphaera sp.]PMP60611.1 MAG: DUF357 domain-containing protein [Caldisphaera sp.]PMP89805.1 MAG: DUF357 domain-containing protein [Caldisphaera sp.]
MSGSYERVQKYIDNVEFVMKDLINKREELKRKGLNIDNLLQNINAYLNDSKYYLKIDKIEDAFISISYAEGLIDSLKFLSLIDIKWSNEEKDLKKVFIAGTFDILHPGHINLLRFASQFGKVYVVIARDKNAEKDKGRPVILDEKSRLELISSIKYTYEAILGDEKDYIKPIEEIKPDIIVLGPDQQISEEKLAQIVESRINKRPIIIRYKEKEAFSGDLRGSTDILLKACGLLKQNKNIVVSKSS